MNHVVREGYWCCSSKLKFFFLRLFPFREIWTCLWLIANFIYLILHYIWLDWKKPKKCTILASSTVMFVLKIAYLWGCSLAFSKELGLDEWKLISWLLCILKYIDLPSSDPCLNLSTDFLGFTFKCYMIVSSYFLLSVLSRGWF